jgi:hypothetical protein
VANPDIIQKIRDLRRLAADTTNVHEAEVALSAAARLIERHRLEEAEIEATTGEAAEEAMRIEDALGSAVSIPVWQQTLAVTLATHHGCAILFQRKPGGTDMIIFGRPGDAALLRETYTYLLLDLLRISAKEARGKGTSWKRSWLVGAVHGMAEKLAEARRVERATTAASVTALTLLDDRASEAREAALAGPGARERRLRRSRVHGDAFGDGKEHGRNVSLDKARPLPGGMRALPAARG